MARLMILSSDGHAVGPMESYRQYLDPQCRADFDDFLPVWREFGALAISEKGLGLRLDDHVVDAWRDNFLEEPAAPRATATPVVASPRWTAVDSPARSCFRTSARRSHSAA